MKKELGINKIFNADGSIKHFCRSSRNRPGRKISKFLFIQVTTPDGNRLQREITLNNRDFDEAYEIAQHKLVELHGLTMTHEIRKGFKQAKCLYW